MDSDCIHGLYVTTIIYFDTQIISDLVSLILLAQTAKTNKHRLGA